MTIDKKIVSILSLFYHKRVAVLLKSYTRPENPINAIAIMPAEMRAIGTPLKDLGTLFRARVSRIPAKSTIARP